MSVPGGEKAICVAPLGCAWTKYPVLPRASPAMLYSGKAQLFTGSEPSLHHIPLYPLL